MSSTRNLTRRAALLTGAAGGVIAALPAAARDDAVASIMPDDSRLLALVAELKAVRITKDKAHRRQFGTRLARRLPVGRYRFSRTVMKLDKRWRELEREIAATPASGPAGIAAKLSLHYATRQADLDYDDQVYLVAAFRDAARLAGEPVADGEPLPAKLDRLRARRIAEARQRPPEPAAEAIYLD
jgi:hypothetical protein